MAAGYPLLELRGITKRYGRVVAVDSIDLAVGPGEFVTLLGPSGCGKTTTLNLVAGFERPDAGEIILDGSAIHHLPPHKRPVNTVFQGYALFPHLNVRENVAFGLRMKRIPEAEIRQRVDEALEMIHMSDLATRDASQLSGGQQQRVALARALVNRPKLLLLDEPLSALDARLRTQMQAELRKIQEQVGISFLYVTHDQEEAMTMSDRVCIMSHGRVIQAGRPQELYEHPRTAFVSSFLGRNNLLEGEIIQERNRIVLRVAARVEIPVGSAVAPRTERVVAAVRPEALAICFEEGANGSTLAGTVEELRFLGDRIEARVAIAPGLTLSVYAPTDTPVARGARVFVRVPPDRVQILEE